MDITNWVQENVYSTGLKKKKKGTEEVKMKFGDELWNFSWNIDESPRNYQ